MLIQNLAQNRQKVSKPCSFHMFPLLGISGIFCFFPAENRTSKPCSRSVRLGGYSSPTGPPVDLNTYIYIYRDVEYEDCLFVILLVFMTSYYVSMCLQHLSIIYIYISSYTYIQWFFPISKLNSKSTYVFKRSLNLGSLQLEMESHHQIASAQVVCLTGRQNLPKSKAAIGKTTSRSWKKHAIM